MQINTLAEYVAWRTEWRAKYKDTSEYIRVLKRARWELSSPKGDPVKGLNMVRETGCPIRWGWEIAGYIAGAKETATNMLEERKESKERARELWALTHS